MPRVYKSDPRGSTYKKYDTGIIQEAIEYYKANNKSLKVVAEKYNIDKSVLYRHSTRTMKKQGGQTVLSEETEEHMIKYINICADWGYPFDSIDLRFLIKCYLDKLGRTVLKFKNNLPGPDFVRSFLKRHKDQISQRNCQNIKRNRAAVSPDSIKYYFKELEVSLAGIEPGNILNYDETNLTDDPGRKKIITKRGTKYPERVMNHSKASISVMMSATAEGVLLPPYVVYKAQNLYDTWTENGPAGTRYNRSQTGWFDANLFEDWIKTIVLPYFRNKEGKKCLIGDNLSSHISLDVIRLCHEQNISFVFLPANSTHLTQPLDVAFFRPMKIAWRNILLQWKKTDGKTQASVSKGCFPRLLKTLIENLNENSKENILAGFRKTGILPIDQSQVLSRLPKENEAGNNDDTVEKSVLDILKEMRYGTMNITEPKRKRKLDIIPGQSVGTSNDNYKETGKENLQEIKEKRNSIPVLTRETNEISKKTNNIGNKKEGKIGKGKGKGKKTKIQDHQTKEKQNEETNINELHLMRNITPNEITNFRQEINNINEINNTDYKTDKKIEKDKNEGKIERKDEPTNKDKVEYREYNAVDCPFNFDNLTSEDFDSVPIIFEDILLDGDEICAETEINYEQDETKTNNKEEKKEKRRIKIKREKELKMYQNLHEDKNKVKIIANEIISDNSKKRKVQINLNKSQNIYLNSKLNLSGINYAQASTSGIQRKISARRSSYYKNDAEILKDLLDHDV